MCVAEHNPDVLFPLQLGVFIFLAAFVQMLYFVSDYRVLFFTGLNKAPATVQLDAMAHQTIVRYVCRCSVTSLC